MYGRMKQQVPLPTIIAYNKKTWIDSGEVRTKFSWPRDKTRTYERLNIQWNVTIQLFYVWSELSWTEQHSQKEIHFFRVIYSNVNYFIAFISFQSIPSRTDCCASKRQCTKTSNEIKLKKKTPMLRKKKQKKRVYLNHVPQFT